MMSKSYPFSSRTKHFVQPKQWASMRVAKEAGKKDREKNYPL